MDLGSTLQEIASKCAAEDYSPDFFMQSIDTISRSQANRLCKYLKRNHTRRQLKQKKKKNVLVGRRAQKETTIVNSTINICVMKYVCGMACVL